jgi:hypothetical protein
MPSESSTIDRVRGHQKAGNSGDSQAIELAYNPQTVTHKAID